MERRIAALESDLGAKEVQSSARALQALAECNQAVVRATSEKGLLQEVCRIIVEHCGYVLAWVGYVRHDRECTVKPVAQKGYDEGYIEKLYITWADNERGRGPTGTAVRTAIPVTAKNIQRDPRFSPWREEAVKRGYFSSIALPLKNDKGKVFGTLNIYADRPYAFDNKEQSLLSSMADDLAYGIIALRTRAKQLQAEKKLRERIREMTAINKLSRRVCADLSLEQVAQAVFEEVTAMFGPDTVFLFLKQDNRLILHNEYSPEGNKRFPAELPIHKVGKCLCGIAAQEKKPVYSANIQRDPRCILPECKEADFRSAAVLPLCKGRDIVGVLGLASYRRRSFLKQATFLETVANEISVGLQNALLYEKVKNYGSELEQCVAEQTRELLENNKKLEELDRLKSMFMAAMSHELRTPLNSIIGFSGIMLRGLSGPVSKEQDKQLNMVYNSATQLLNLINELLDLSKIEAGKMELYLEDVNIKEVLKEAVDTVYPQIREKGLRLTTRIPQQGFLLHNDRAKIRQILLNLLSNAVKFTEVGKIEVEVEGSERNGELVVSVSDTGIGIDKKDLRGIFDAFKQLRRPAAGKSAGSGLGLSITKNLVHILGGEIRVTSTPGQGSKFSFSLPFSPPPADSHRKTKQKTQP